MEEILALERAAMDRWAKGDPDGFLEISDASVTYFDPFVEKRLNGLSELRTLYGKLRGQIRIDRYQFIEPRVQVAGDMAVLSYNFESYGNEQTLRWNTTEVYERKSGVWRIIHTHWSLTQPQLK
jgi:hypothetical protein